MKQKKIKNYFFIFCAFLCFLSIFCFLFRKNCSFLQYAYANSIYENQVNDITKVKDDNSCEINRLHNLSNEYNEDITAVSNANSELAQHSLDVTFKSGNKKLKQTLKIRKEAEKYVCDIDGINFNKLSEFLTLGYKRLIDKESLLKFCFVNFDGCFEKVNKFYTVESENASINVIKNTGGVILKSAKCGQKLVKNREIFNIFDKLVQKTCEFDVKLELQNPEVSDAVINKYSSMRGHFYTTYASSSIERKNNIEKALSAFDGLVINPGEVLSFNQTTGRRSEESGYMGAKIIVNGDFVEGVGGGVCQASTTLYNACLVSGLEVIEANPHSLNVSYIAPSFDAMVNFGSSDLKIKNNTAFPITFATKCDGEKCEVFVYGEKNPYKIIRRSEVIEEISPDETIFIDNDENLIVFDDGFIKYPKKGLVSESYLDYFDGDKLVSTKKLRRDKYNPTRGIAIKANINFSENDENI